VNAFYNVMTLVTFNPFNSSQKSNKRLMAGTIVGETKERKTKEKAKRRTIHKNPKKGES
jgi:hypothetical protein